MLTATFKKYILNFKQPAGTSRGVLLSKKSWFISIYHDDKVGIGECSILPNLSIDDNDDFEKTLKQVCDDINNWQYWFEEGLFAFPAIRFGLEMAMRDLSVGGSKILFPSPFTDSKDKIATNGLIWMGDYLEMRKRIIDKIESGYRCIKVKIGALNFRDDINLLKLIREDFSDKDIEIRLDANGAFDPNEAIEKLNELSKYDIHSIEQPIKQHQWGEMAKICSNSPIPIALDEELIGVYERSEIRSMLETIKPNFIILKPSLLGGWKQSNVFVEEAENYNIGWWVTSALESNIGLNAIAQWAYTLQSKLPQGLGTGHLFTNNIPSPLQIVDAGLVYNNLIHWDLTELVNV